MSSSVLVGVGSATETNKHCVISERLEDSLQIADGMVLRLLLVTLLFLLAEKKNALLLHLTQTGR